MVWKIEISDEELAMLKEQYFALYQIGYRFSDVLEQESATLLRVALEGLEDKAKTLHDLFVDATKPELGGIVVCDDGTRCTT